MIAAVALLACLIGLAWMFHSQRRRHRQRRADLEQQLASSRNWYHSATAKPDDDSTEDPAPRE